MKTIIALFSLLLALGLGAGASLGAGAEALPPDVLVKSTAQDVLAIIKQDKDIQSGNSQKVLELVEKKVLPHFDFGHMTMLAVGKHWAKASPSQKSELTSQFRAMLVRTYSAALTNYRDQVVEYKPFKMAASDTEVIVKTSIKQPGGQPIPIDYSLEKQDGGWKIYDLAVDGVSLVTNYRSSFNAEIQNAGIDGLIKTLAAKNRSENQGGKTK